MELSKTNSQQIIDTAKLLVAEDKGLLAMDESNPTCNKRFAKLGSPKQKMFLKIINSYTGIPGDKMEKFCID